MRCPVTGADCPDPEACQSGYPCDLVQSIAEIVRDEATPS